MFAVVEIWRSNHLVVSCKEWRSNKYSWKLWSSKNEVVGKFVISKTATLCQERCWKMLLEQFVGRVCVCVCASILLSTLRYRMKKYTCVLPFTGYRLCRGPLQHSMVRWSDVEASARVPDSLKRRSATFVRIHVFHWFSWIYTISWIFEDLGYNVQAP